MLIYVIYQFLVFLFRLIFHECDELLFQDEQISCHSAKQITINYWMLRKNFIVLDRHCHVNGHLNCCIFYLLKEKYRIPNWFLNKGVKTKLNKGNAKHGVSPRLKIWPGNLDLWPWKSIGFPILLRTKYVPSLVKIHWRMLILECSQGCYVVKFWPGFLDL